MRQEKNRLWHFVLITLAAIGFIFGAGQKAPAQDQKIDATELIRDTQKSSNAGGGIDMAWWIPDEFWKVSLANRPNSTPEQQEMLLKVVHPYFIVGIISGKSGLFGAITFRPGAEIRDLVQLKDNEGNIYKPLADDKIDASVPALLGLMKPVMARAMGPMGENLNFFVFEGTKKDGTRRYDPLKDGGFEIDFGERVFKWKLPLNSLLPKQKCPVCGEILSGTYKYCPYDGTKLAGNK